MVHLGYHRVQVNEKQMQHVYLPPSFPPLWDMLFIFFWFMHYKQNMFSTHMTPVL